MARLARVPVQTVFIETDTPYLSKGWPILKKPSRLPMHCRVRLGRRFEVGSDVNAFVSDLQRYFADELAGASLGELWAADGDGGLAEPQREPVASVEPHVPHGAAFEPSTSTYRTGSRLER